MNLIIEQLTQALHKLEQTAFDSQLILEQERQKRITITTQLQQSQQELKQLIDEEESMIQKQVYFELEQPLQIGQQYQDKLNKEIEEATYIHRERTYVVDELQNDITNLRNEYYQLEKQLQKSQAKVSEQGNNLKNKQEEYLQLKQKQIGTDEELKQLQDEVQEMKDMLSKLKDVQYTLNKVINKEKRDNQKLDQTNSTEGAFKVSLISSLPNSVQDEFWYQAPQTPPLKLPKIK